MRAPVAGDTPPDELRIPPLEIHVNPHHVDRKDDVNVSHPHRHRLSFCQQPKLGAGVSGWRHSQRQKVAKLIINSHAIRQRK